TREFRRSRGRNRRGVGRWGDLHPLVVGPGAAGRGGEILGAMPTPRTRLSDRRIATLALAALAWLTACERPVGCTGDYCGTLVIRSPRRTWRSRTTPTRTRSSTRRSGRHFAR